MTLLKPLDLNKAAVEQHGTGAKAILTGSHLWNWKVDKGGRILDLDMNRAASSQYPGHYAAHNGVHAYDWGAVDLAAQGYKVLPVLIVPRDLFFDIEGVRQALGRYTNNCQAARIWYAKHNNGRTFQLLDTLICYSPQSSDDWDHYVYLNTLAGAENKERLLNESVAAFESALPFRGENLRITICAHTGLDTDDWQGAMNKGKYRAIPPRAAAVQIDMSNLRAGSIEADALYALLHELGHGFDLPHPKDRNPQPQGYGWSFMQATKPPDAIALDIERAELSQSKYFNT